MHAPCCRRQLAYDSMTRVDLCSCGHAHLSIGPLTIRLEPDALRAIGSVILAAAQELPETAAAARPATGAMGTGQPIN